jgi:Protein of unknown function (DUF3455)
MKTRTTRLILACIVAMSIPVTASAQPGDPLDPRTYAPESKPFLTVNASGVQRYACQANGTWLFTDPVAELYKPASANAIGTHYLNFASGRPIWEHKDGSMVEAARKASAPAGPGNIPELLLEAVGTAPGVDGDRFANATWVQRLNTSGGVAPAGTCTPGATVAVPYTTDYVFWKSGN